MEKILNQKKLFNEQIQKLIENTIFGWLASLFNSLVLVIILWGEVNKNRLLLWFLSIITIGLIRIYFQNTYKHIENTQKSLKKWENIFNVTLAASGIIWGSAAFVIFPSDSIIHQSFLAFIVGGLVAGSVGVFSVRIRSFLLYSVPVLFPLIIRFLLLGDSIHIAMGLMLFLFWLIMLMTTKKFNIDITNFFFLKFENIELISKLEEEVENRKTTEKNLIVQNQKIEKIVAERTFELKASEEKHRTLIESMPNGFYISTAEGYFLEANPAFISMLGYDGLDELKTLYIPTDIYVHETERETTQQNTEFINQFETYQLKRKDGKIIWIEDHARYIRNKDGLVLYNQGICRNVTDQKLAEDINKTLFAISNAVNLTSNLDDLYKQIHNLLGKIIDVTNFYFAIVNEKKHTLYFPYYVDTIDEDFSPITNFDPKDSLTGFVVSNRKPLLLEKEKLQELADKNGVWGPVPLIWMGVPLIVKDEIIGVIVVQSYTDPHIYSQENLKVLISISDQMAIAIDRKRTEDVLKENEKKYRYLFENGSDLICLHDLNGNFLDTNLPHKKEYGWRQQDIVGKNIRDLIPGQHMQAFDQYLARILKKGKDEGYLKGYTKSGKKIIMEYRNKLILNKDGKPEAVQGTARDITDRWKAEKKLESSEKRYRALFEKAEDAIFILDASPENMGRIVDANQGAAIMHGYTVEELKKLNIKDLDAPLNANKVEGPALPVFEGEWIKNEINHVRKDGSIFPVEISAGLLEIDHNNFILAIDRDIGERKTIEDRLRRSEKMEAIGTLAGGIAHDFNNILSAILGSTELALMETQKESAVTQNLHQVYEAGNRAKDLVKQILTVARQSDNVMTQICVASITKEALKLIRASLPSTIEIEQKIESESLIIGDSTQIHQIIMNLCTNAAHAMEEKGGVLKVSLSDAEVSSNSKNKNFNFKPGNYIKLVVSDNGVGIPNDVIKSIFEPYFTTKKLGEGTGLGLAIAHGIVEAHGGEITVDTAVGAGTKFTVYLPISQKINRDLSNNNKDGLVTGNEHILFVDDEAAILEINKQFLEKMGYSVSTRINGIEALDLFQAESNKFDLVITDMTMPKMTGDVLATKLRAINPDIPIIICTGYSKKMSNELATEIGINAICYKPFSLRDLAKTIRNILDQ
jgi:PAS domain S-box-containing protein